MGQSAKEGCEGGVPKVGGWSPMRVGAWSQEMGGWGFREAGGRGPMGCEGGVHEVKGCGPWDGRCVRSHGM